MYLLASYNWQGIYSRHTRAYRVCLEFVYKEREPDPQKLNSTPRVLNEIRESLTRPRLRKHCLNKRSAI